MNLHFSIRNKSLSFWNLVTKYRLTLTIYIGVFFSSILGAVWVHRVRPSDLKYPWGVFESDISGVYAMAQAAGQSWTGTTTNSMGAPFQADFSKVILIDDLHLFFIRILAHLTSNPFTAINAYYLLSFGFSAVTFLYASNHFSVRRLISFPLALSYAWLPYHFSRMHVGHLFLAAYYMLPIGVLILHRLFQSLLGEREKFFPTNTSKRLCLIIGIVLVGSSGSYYGMFFSLLACSLLFLVIPTRLSVQILNKIFLTAVVALLFISAPFGRSFLAQHNGLNSYASRSADESVQFGGSIARLFIPWGTWLPDKLKPAVTMMEFEWNATPLLGVLGMWSLLVFCGISIANKDNGSKNYNRSIVYLFPWSVLIYAAGGFGYVFALSIDPSFRAWNRISVLILTLGLLMLGILLNRIKSLAILYVLSPLILVATITTQLFPLSSVGIGREPHEASKVTFTALSEDAKKIQGVLRPGCSVLQLPIMMSPEGGQVGDVGNGEHYWLPLLTKDLKWSYGAGKGTIEGSFWQNYAGANTSIAIQKAKELGFCAVLVNLQGQLNREEIVSILGTPEFENAVTGNSLFRILR
jgi:phosphoglycerol transferase